MTPDERIMELEIKVAFQDKLLADLDEVVRQLRDQLETLRDDLVTLTESLQPQRGEIVDEKPPHW